MSRKALPGGSFDENKMLSWEREQLAGEGPGARDPRRTKVTRSSVERASERSSGVRVKQERHRLRPTRPLYFEVNSYMTLKFITFM